MFKQEEIALDFIYDIDSPKVIFDLVMEYAEKSKKREWECFGTVFSQNNVTVVFRLADDGYPIGYLCGHYLPTNDFFVEHGYVRTPVINCNELLNRVGEKIVTNYNMPLGNFIINSDLPEKVWEKWGFMVSNEKIFKKKLGG